MPSPGLQPPTFAAAATRLRAYLREQTEAGVSHAKLADRAGLPTATVTALIRRQYRGNVSTLMALEAIIPPDWRTDDVSSSASTRTPHADQAAAPPSPGSPSSSPAPVGAA